MPREDFACAQRLRSRLGRSSMTFLFEIWRGASDPLIRIRGFEKTAPAQ